LRSQRKSKAQLGTNLANIQPHFINPLLDGSFLSRGKYYISFMTHLFIEKKRGPSIVVARPLKNMKQMKRPAPIVPTLDPTQFLKRQRGEAPEEEVKLGESVQESSGGGM
jgi:hypothetical protein